MVTSFCMAKLSVLEFEVAAVLHLFCMSEVAGGYAGKL